MRRPLTFLTLAAILLAPTGCGRSGEEQVRDTVDDYLEARRDSDFERVCDLFSADFRTEQGGAACAQSQRTQANAQPGATETKIVVVKVRGESATVELDVSHGPEAPSRTSLELVKEDGDWRIASTV